MSMYGTCPHCGGELYAVWFTEDETVVANGCLYRTGRKRSAVSHLVCNDCFTNQAVDDTYDGAWY